MNKLEGIVYQDVTGLESSLPHPVHIHVPSSLHVLVDIACTLDNDVEQ